MRKGGLEPPRGYPHYHLKVARIPIPPLPHSVEEQYFIIGRNIYARKNQGLMD